MVSAAQKASGSVASAQSAVTQATFSNSGASPRIFLTNAILLAPKQRFLRAHRRWRASINAHRREIVAILIAGAAISRFPASTKNIVKISLGVS
jgi:hypothetical protein